VRRRAVLWAAAAIVVSLASAHSGEAQAGIQTSTDLVCHPPVVTLVSGMGTQSNTKAAIEQCQVTVTSEDGVTSPTGGVTVTSTGDGSFDGTTAAGPGCTLATGSPPDSSCTIDYTPGKSDIGIVTLSASYTGSADDMPSAGVTSSFEVRRIVHAIPGVTASAARLQSSERAVQAVALGDLNTTSPFPSPIAKLSLTIAAPLSFGEISQVFNHLAVLGASPSHPGYRPVPHRSLEHGHTITVRPIEPPVDLKLRLTGSAIVVSPSAARALRGGHQISVVLTVTAVNMAGDVGHRRVRVRVSPTP
jgi:hypothetical protein